MKNYSGSIKHIAKLANVNPSTVSRALHNNPSISTTTRDLIKKIALELNYTPNRAAVALSTKRSSLITVVVPTHPESSMPQVNQFMLEALPILSVECAANGFQCLIVNPPNNDLRSCKEEFILGRLSEGVIVLGPMIFEDDLIDLARHQIPMVSWGPVPATLENSITVMSGDNEMGGYLATRYLLEKGRRSLAFFGDPSEMEVSSRYVGFQRALSEFGLNLSHAQLLRLSGPINMTNPTEPIDLFFNETLENRNKSTSEHTRVASGNFPIDGIVAVSDVFAMGAITSLARRKIKVPEDVSVIGYDDLRASAFFNPPLTTITQDFAHAAQYISRSLAEFIVNDQQRMISQTKLPVRLIIRQSA